MRIAIPLWVGVFMLLALLFLCIGYSNTNDNKVTYKLPVVVTQTRSELSELREFNPFSIISAGHDYCISNPFLVGFDLTKIQTYEDHYTQWWKTRYTILYDVLTDYYAHPLVNEENKVNPEDYWELSKARAGESFINFIHDVNTTLECPYGGLKLFGRQGGTGKWLCGLDEYDIIIEEHKSKYPQFYKHSSHYEDCVVYSLGSNNLFDFESAVSNKTPCKIYTFDCTSNPPEQRIPRLQFEKLCMGRAAKHNADQNLQLKIFPYTNTPPLFQSKAAIPILKSMKLDSYYSIAIDRLTLDHVSVLKMDIEGAEYSVFLDLFSNPKFEVESRKLAPFQISLETHWWSKGIAHAMLSLEMFNMLYQQGYRVMYSEAQDDPTCWELVFMRVFC